MIGNFVSISELECKRQGIRENSSVNIENERELNHFFGFLLFKFLSMLKVYSHFRSISPFWQPADTYLPSPLHSRVVHFFGLVHHFSMFPSSIENQ